MDKLERWRLFLLDILPYALPLLSWPLNALGLQWVWNWSVRHDWMPIDALCVPLTYWDACLLLLLLQFATMRLTVKL